MCEICHVTFEIRAWPDDTVCAFCRIEQQEASTELDSSVESNSTTIIESNSTVEVRSHGPDVTDDQIGDWY